MKKIITTFLLIFCVLSAGAQSKLFLENKDMKESLTLPGNLTFTHPDGEKGWWDRGLNMENDGTYDLRPFYALRFKMQTNVNSLVTVTCLLNRAELEGRRNLLSETKVTVQTQGAGWQLITIPLKNFDYHKGQGAFLKYIKKVQFHIAYTNGQKGNARIKDFCFVKGNTLELSTDIYSKPLDEAHQTSYTVKVVNVSEQAQSLSLAMQQHGWEGMKVKLSPKQLYLLPNQEAAVRVFVQGSSYLPAGAHEKHVLLATPLLNNATAEQLELISVVPVTSPFLRHDKTGWEEVKAKIGKYEWATKAYNDLLQEATGYVVPQVKPGTMSDQGTEGLVRAYIEGPLHNTAVAYYFTGDKSYGEKVAETLRRVSDPVLGYPRTQHLTFQGIPQEGGTMEGMLVAYDLIKESGLLTVQECWNVENMFRQFIGNIIDMMDDGGISNWSVFNLGPAAQCALLIHDMDLYNKLLYGSCGILDQFRYGTMDDGWWYEMSLSYNLGAAACFTELALASRPFGIDLLNYKFPSSLTPNVGLRPFEYENFQGMAFGKFGPLKNNTVDIKRMWDGILIYPDYRGVMFGMGDGHEQLVAGSQFELAYYTFRDPRYASILKRSDKRNLIWGVGELPQDTPNLAAISGYSDNAGIAVLRSQTKGREQKDQIQVAMKYGTHGSYHGHFDRISLLSLMRYGRSFYNPETSWFGYGSYMYKWWVQPSLAHNMVVVDGQMQEPTTCEQLLFHSGEMMQVVASATDARWSNPPYMGGYDYVRSIKCGDVSYVPIPDNAPRPTDIGTYSEPVHQRRIMVLTDDYVVIADYLKGKEVHTFDNLLHLRGVMPGSDLKWLVHRSQFDTDPLGSGQFITNVNQYQYTDGGQVKSIHHFAPKGLDGKNLPINNWETGGQNYFYNEPGSLMMDAYMAWPSSGKIGIADYAEDWGVDKKLDYKVLADGKQVAFGVLGTWILGKENLNVALKGKKELIMKVKTNRREDKRKTLLLADAYLITENGKKIALSTLAPLMTNVAVLPEKGKDYECGPIKISGTPYKECIGIEPEQPKEEAVLTYDLQGLNVVRLEGVVGGDYPVGNEDQLRKVVNVRLQGKEARFVTVIEPYESISLVKKVYAISPSEIIVELTDGRTQAITFQDFYGVSCDVNVSIVEMKNGKLERTESTIH